MKEGFHIGKLILDKLQDDGRRVSWLAKHLHCDKSNIYRLFKSPTIDTKRLLKIFILLNYDFFALYSAFISSERKKTENL